MKYLFWNTNCKNVNNTLELIIKSFSCDIVALAEYTNDIKELLVNLDKDGHSFYHIPKIGCEKIDIITKYTPGKIEHSREASHYTIKKVPHESLGYHLIVFVHFASKLYDDPEDFIEAARIFKYDIEQAEKETSNNNTLVLGDFNMNPFERGMVTAAALHAISSRKIAQKYSRTVKDKTYDMFYNPMWNLFGDLEEPPGTYYYNKSSQINYFWHMFDQVLIRPTLINNFDLRSLKILSHCGNIKLVNDKGIPNLSDHLPIYFELK